MVTAPVRQADQTDGDEMVDDHDFEILVMSTSRSAEIGTQQNKQRCANVVTELEQVPRSHPEAKPLNNERRGEY